MDEHCRSQNERTRRQIDIQHGLHRVMHPAPVSNNSSRIDRSACATRRWPCHAFSRSNRTVSQRSDLSTGTPEHRRGILGFDMQFSRSLLTSSQIIQLQLSSVHNKTSKTVVLALKVSNFGHLKERLGDRSYTHYKTGFRGGGGILRKNIDFVISGLCSKDRF